MGEVYLAEDTRLGRRVALKFLTGTDRTDKDARARLVREAQTAALLRSPHVAVTYDLVEHNDAIFIAMELVEGELLSDRLTRGPLPLPDSLDIAIQVADALDEAHGHGIVHRDIKSSNLMLTPRQLVKVLDFGLAKFLAPELVDQRTLVNLTMPGAVLGTVSYMSPEQLRGGAVDHRTDLFALGVVLYEMLAGVLPFPGASMTEIADRILHEEPDAIARFNYNVPPHVEAIVRKCLEKQADRRYQSARELFIDLSAARRRLSTGDTTPGQSGAWHVLGETSGRESSRTGLTSVPASSGRHLTQGQRSVAVLSFANITADASDDWIGQGIAETLTADLKNVPGLSVLPREQIFDQLRSLAALGRGLDERQAIDVGRRLGAWWVLTGGYQHLGPRIRITAYVIEVLTGRLSGTVKLDGKMEEIFELQDQVVLEVAKSLNLHMESHAALALVIEGGETSSIEAYEAFSRGMLNLRLAGRESFERAISLFEHAIERDPHYAEAIAGLGTALQLKASFLSLPALNERAIGLLREAIELKPGLLEARVRLGMGLLGAGRVDEATQLLERAVREQPDHAMAHATLARAYWLGHARVADGIQQLEEAVAIYPEAGYAHLQLALLYAMSGQLDDAERAARAAIVLQEHAMSGTQGLLIVGAHVRLGYVQYLRGEYDAATASYRRELEFIGASDHALRDRSSIEVLQKLAAASFRKGDQDLAASYGKRALEAFSARLSAGADDPFTRYYIATLLGIQGDAEGARQHLAYPLAQLPAFTRWRLARDPDFVGVRDQDGFHDLVQGGSAAAAAGSPP